MRNAGEIADAFLIWFSRCMSRKRIKRVARYPPSSSFSMGAARDIGSLQDPKRPTTLPCRSTRNLGSVPLNSLHTEEPEDSRPGLLKESIERIGMGAVHVDFGEVGEADAIIYSQKEPISTAVPGSCAPNWFEGKPRTTNPRSL